MDGKINFFKGIRFKFAVAIILVLLFDSIISHYILNFIHFSDRNLGVYGIQLNIFLNIIIGTTLIVLLLNYLVIRPIQTINETISRFENGESEARISLRIKDELYLLAEQLNNFLDLIIHYGQNQTNQLSIVEEGTHEVAEKIEQFKSRLDSIRTFSQKLAGQSQEQVAAFEETASISQSMSEEMESVRGQLNQLNHTFEGVQTKADKGITKIHEVSTVFKELKTKVADEKHIMKQLSDEIQTINDIVSLVKEVSEQTNLLALNASIEAARAGEYGKGFEVVAGEIRKLAESSLQATDRISDTVEGLLKTVELSVAQSNARVVDFGDSVDQVFSMNEAFQGIIQDIMANSQSIRDINQYMTQMTESSKEIVLAMEKLSEDSEKTSQDILNINGDIDYQLNEVVDINSNIRQIKEAFNPENDVRETQNQKDTQLEGKSQTNAKKEVAAGKA